MAIDLKTTATKGAISGGVAGLGSAIASVIVMIAKHYKMEITVEEALAFVTLFTTASAGAGRAIENAVKFFVGIKKMIKEESK